MFSEKHNEPAAHKTVSEMVSEHPTTIQTSSPSAERQRKKSINEADEIESEFVTSLYILCVCKISIFLKFHFFFCLQRR
jgi:hypothetical protein